jgi:glycosyltransferase involved in cell wall biosynthesis
MSDTTATLPLVSVVISTYREASAGLLQPCVESVRTQTYANFECIIVGDATADAPIIQAMLAEMNDPRFVFHNLDVAGGPKDSGTKPKQHGANMARGKYLCFLDADDSFLPAHIQVLVDAMEADASLDMAFGDTQFYMPFGKAGRELHFTWRHPWNEKARTKLMTRCNFLSSSEPMMRTTSYRACGGIQRDGYLNDWRLWQRLIESGHDKFRHVPGTITRYYAPQPWQFGFLFYLSRGLPFNMARAVEKQQLPGQSGLLTRLFKGKKRAAEVAKQDGR